MKNRLTTILLVSTVLVLLLSACSAVNGLSDVKSTGEAFMTALKNGDHTTSWNMLTTSVQDELGSEPAWEEWASIRAFPEWKFTNNQVENNEAQLDGEATLDGVTYDVTLVFDKTDTGWLVSGINFQEK